MKLQPSETKIRLTSNMWGLSKEMADTSYFTTQLFWKLHYARDRRSRISTLGMYEKPRKNRNHHVITIHHDTKGSQVHGPPTNYWLLILFHSGDACFLKERLSYTNSAPFQSQWQKSFLLAGHLATSICCTSTGGTVPSLPAARLVVSHLS